MWTPDTIADATIRLYNAYMYWEIINRFSIVIATISVLGFIFFCGCKFITKFVRRK